MSHNVIKITILESGEKIEKSEQKWCLLENNGDTSRTLCKGEAIDGSSEYTYESKTVVKGGITCSNCLNIIQFYKSIKL